MLGRYFASLGVASICLPSAQETIVTWTEGFGFQHMSEERLAATRSELHVLIFPGLALQDLCCPNVVSLSLPLTVTLTG